MKEKGASAAKSQHGSFPTPELGHSIAQQRSKSTSVGVVAGASLLAMLEDLARLVDASGPKEQPSFNHMLVLVCFVLVVLYVYLHIINMDEPKII